MESDEAVEMKKTNLEAELARVKKINAQILAALIELKADFSCVCQKAHENDESWPSYFNSMMAIYEAEGNVANVAAAPETAAERDRLNKINVKLLAAAKKICWGQNRIVQDYWNDLHAAIAEAEGGSK